VSWPEKTAPTTDASEKRSIGQGVFKKCDACSATMLTTEFAAAFEVCPACGQHHPLPLDGWFKLLLDGGELETWDAGLEPTDPLRFSDGKSYKERIASAQKRASARESVEIGRAKMDGIDVAFGAFVFAFMGGSMGSVAGEKVTRLFERATTEKLPVVLLQASGGARMQEGILSLMQMAKAVAALERFKAVRMPFISVLLHPTTGGVAASFAFLGDVNVAEPKALIGFAGPRVIENTLRQQLPRGFQRSEFLLDHGMIDVISSRLEMKRLFVTLIQHFTSHPRSSPHGSSSHPASPPRQG
jgi:acetyl-CoA carboxylase carboxyl transferase subunit beta